MSDIKKLKRGLSDVSPLFREEEKEKEGEVQKLSFSIPKGTLVWLSVFSPEAPEDSLFLCTYLASRLAALECGCSILSLSSEKNSPFHVMIS